MKKTTFLLIILAMVLLPATMAFAAGTKDDGVERHAFIFKNTGNPYGDKQMQGFADGIEEMGFEAITRAPDQPTAEAQIQIIEQLIAQKVDSISITGNDFDALQPALRKAMDAGIAILSADSAVNPESRITHINQADSEMIGRTLIQAAYDMAEGAGEIAVLSATSQASNQNLWIEWMKKELDENSGKYANLKLVRIAYGDDLRDKSVSETEGLLQSFPNLEVIIAPTTVGIAAAGRVITDRGLIGQIDVTGLGLPSEMAEYIENGSCPYMFLWNPIDVGYLTAYAAVAASRGELTGAAGEFFSAGRLGEFSVVKASDGGTEVLLGAPFKFEPSNIGEWKSVY
ncbi:Predicted L-rhamnose ABC transporter, substrate-binding component [Olavius algarvensis spirochete endosymbiont]|uniref:rhamnose ABC transporter substrate-binding protein n=1 Tax=Olavius algarvensis spirochete endosymbiont TaxID=260710 RepID=UPI000F14396A|nr:rhamnose ABC transporter substrate-binding protein [Olavius algarvensis spirochete endosymbiont]VDB01138.1 Predicted L-rhamnose ABC transporter, substrate-binding component [Olavius algarvensis spirochete endosymbiont]